MTGYLWCEVCKALRPVNIGHPRYDCHRCGWDMRARVANALERYHAWRDLHR